MMEFEKYINQAEDIFINGNTFDSERIDFITNLETCDLLAVPGSGKTTALLAKLYCLTQNMPFEDNSGILVLAHTNHSVDEIENKLKNHCPQLFQYPNFVGTIQSFVNEFLANQACFEKHGCYIRKNDDDLIHDIILKKLKVRKGKAYWYLTNIIKAKFNKIEISYVSDRGVESIDVFFEKLINLKIINKKREFKFDYNIIKNSELSYSEKKILFDFNDFLKRQCENDSNWLEVIKTINYNEEKESFNSINFKYALKITTDSGKEFKEIFDELRVNGNLKFYDSFEIGVGFLEQYPATKEILQKRFNYIFIDEMQDLEDFQIKVIDDIFFNNDAKTIIQRIGDVNQSIFNSGKKVKIECDWKPRNKKFLKNSLRLTNEVASLVNKFILEPQYDDCDDRLVVKGCKIIDKTILPHLIIINEKTTSEQIKEKFNQLIIDNKLHMSESNKKDGFHIIGWSTEWDDEEKSIDSKGIKRYRLKDFFNDYQKESKQKREDFNCLKKHLYLFDKEKQTLEAIRKSILNALVRILRIEEIYKDQAIKHYYRKTNLIEFFKSQGDEFYDNFNSKLFSWCFDIIINKNYVDVYEDLKKFIESNSFIGLNWYNEENYFPKLINKSKDFLNEEFDFQLSVENSKNGKAQTNEIEIRLSSVHAVKGQTHCATMYIESSYYNYETKKTQIKDVLLGTNHTFKIGEKSKGKNAGEKDAQAKQALKMMYVGFSRPTHLLCFTVLEENVKGDRLLFDKAGWKWDDDLIN
ncbi:UvrD-helicase domain-containing protein [Flavobacterium tructae]|uniref:UvrD-helicase domain-containing protein n=1 Tax=Flavobacterium tructae TaxID=1114873 RepID=UPI0035A90A66